MAKRSTARRVQPAAVIHKKNNKQTTMAAASVPQVNYGDYPLKDIPQPHPHDVLCGRGGGSNNHIGNSHWRMLVAANKQLYITLPKRQKMLLSRSIVNAVRSQNPPGRFLQKDSKTNKWYDVGDQKAQEKTSQALREGAPDIRKKVEAEKQQQQQQINGTTTHVESTENPTTGKNTLGDDSTSKIETKTTTSTTTTTSATTTTAVPSPSAQQQQQHHHPNMQHPPPPQYMGHPGMVPYPYYPPGQQQPPPPAGGGGGGGGYPMPYHQYPPPHPHGYANPPPMVMNERGMMVPAMYPHPTMMSPHPASMTTAGPHPSNNNNNNNDNNNNNNDYEPLPAHTNNNNNVPTFDEMFATTVVPPPPPDGGLEPAGLSCGSIMITDQEQQKLEKNNNNIVHNHNNNHHNNNIPEAPNSLDQPGSFGDISMMSVGTMMNNNNHNNMKLEGGTFSFGSMMSYNYTNMPDGGLEAIGTSFGSLSLDTANKEQLFQALEIAGGGPEIPPSMLFKNTTKSTGNLLDCSDTESEDENIDDPQIIARKSAAWDKMRVSVSANLESQKSKSSSTTRGGGGGTTSSGTLGSNELMPPPPNQQQQQNQQEQQQQSLDQTGTVLSLPTTNLERDFSQLSAFDFPEDVVDDDVDDALPAPPVELTKNG